MNDRKFQIFDDVVGSAGVTEENTRLRARPRLKIAAPSKLKTKRKRHRASAWGRQNYWRFQKCCARRSS